RAFGRGACRGSRGRRGPARHGAVGRRHHRDPRAVTRAFVALALVLASSVALAQEEPPVPPHPREEPWYALFQAGVEHLREERFEEAADAFRASYQLEPRVATMCNLALSYDRWGEHRSPALHAYRTCARDDESGRFRAFAE